MASEVTGHLNAGSVVGGEANATPEEAPSRAGEFPKDSDQIPGWLIAVIVLSIILAIVIVYKLYKHFSTKGLRLACCPEQVQPHHLYRRDTSKPLIRSGSATSDGGSMYDEKRKGKPDMV